MGTKWVTLVLAALVALAGCKKAGDGAPVAEAEADRPPLPSAELAELLDAVPADAAVVATLGLREPVWSQLTGGWLVPMEPELRDQLDQELATQLDQLTGLDVREARAAVVYFSDADTGGMLIHGIRGKLAGATGEHAGASIRVFPEGRPILGHRDDVLVVSGSQAELEGILDRLAGGEGGLTGELRARIDRAREGATMAAAADVARLTASTGGAEPMLELPPLPGKLAFASVRGAEGGLRVAVTGEDAALDAIEAQLGMLMTLARAEMTKERATTTEPAERMGATIAYYYAENMLRHLQPVREGDELAVEMPFAPESVGSIAPMVGVVTAVAIPAFMKYIERSKQVEFTIPADEPPEAAAEPAPAEPSPPN